MLLHLIKSHPVQQPRVHKVMKQVPQPRVQTIQTPVSLPSPPPNATPSTVAQPPKLPQHATHSYNLRSRPNQKYFNCHVNACIHISNQELCNAIFDTDSGKMLEFCHLIKKYPEIWSTSMANEFGRLISGVGTRIKTGSDTMQFVPYSQIPPDKIVTYACIVCDYRPLKSEPNRTRLTVGGDRLIYEHETSSDAADLMLIKLLYQNLM